MNSPNNLNERLSGLPRGARWLLYPLFILLGLILTGLALAAIIVVVAYPQLPKLDVLTDYRPKIPLRIFTSDGHLIGEFGEERRDLVKIQDVPLLMKQAILAAEDERFYQHSGIDVPGVIRAAATNIFSGGKRQGASTITMQVARNFFLSSEKTMSRKIYEALLAFKIEHNLSKDEILQLYINQIYLGQRAYGFSSAAQIYFGKPLKDLSVAEFAMLAGLPKAPSSFNPVVNPKRAQIRQQYVLRRMHDLHFITDQQYETALNEPLRVKQDANDFGVKADYVAEMARQMVVEQFGEEAYSRGFRVITTINRAEQEAAYINLRKGVMDYDKRHGYRGAESFIDMSDIKTDKDEELEDALSDVEDYDGFEAAIVLDVSPTQLRAYLKGGEIITVSGDGLRFAARMIDAKAPSNKRLRRGAVIRLSMDDKKQWQVTQLPEVEAAFVAASPIDGAIHALVGGFDYNRNKYNHVIQAWRQPGSSFKPFIYSAALEKGYSPASVVADEPIVIPASETGSQAWEPKNYDGKYDGPMSLRTALMKSKNMVSIRLLKAIGTAYAQDYIGRFGFNPEKHPPYLTMALGAGSVTPWQQLTAYSVFANGGFMIQPHIVKQILDVNGNVMAQFNPPVAGNEELRVIDARNAYLMDSMMRDVALRGTGARADAMLKRHDLAGKTGTTNDYIDAWFCGYQPTLVGIAWIGFDQPRRMGSGETGGTAALPIWIGFMQTALKNVPESYMPTPEGLSSMNTGDPSGKASTEQVYKEHAEGDGEDTEAGPPAAPTKPAAPAPMPAHDNRRAAEKHAESEPKAAPPNKPSGKAAASPD